MRERPHWQAMRRIRPKEPGKPLPEACRKRRSSFGDFSEGSGRFQCEATAGSTGTRCRKDCIGGTARCKTHGGITAALAKARHKGEKIVMATDRRIVRAVQFRQQLLGL